MVSVIVKAMSQALGESIKFSIIHSVRNNLALLKTLHFLTQNLVSAKDLEFLYFHFQFSIFTLFSLWPGNKVN